MSRSVKKNPFCGNAALSDKPGKVTANRMFRRAARNAVRAGNFDGCPLVLNEVFNPYDMPKDGKHLFADPIHRRK